MLDVKNISGGYPGNNVLNGVSFSVGKSELFGILGPNGSGKTTLLKIISGLIAPEHGEIFIQNKPIQTYTPKELAKITAVLPQVSSEVFAYTVKETVSLGRYAHQSGWFHSQQSGDDAIVQEAMETTGVAKFQNKLLHELSGGERQRVFLAQALAQQPKILLLDEPTNHLDLAYQKELLDRMKKWTRERGLTVVSIFHDLNLAGLYCDRILLLNEGKTNIIGDPHDVLQEVKIREVYKTKVVKQQHPEMPQPQMLLSPESLQTEENILLDERFFQQTETSIEYHSPIPLKIMATDVGIGWQQSFSGKPGGEVRTGMVGGAFLVTTPNLTWIFIQGILSEAAFMDIAMIVAAARGRRNLVIGATQTGQPLNIDKFTEKIADLL